MFQLPQVDLAGGVRPFDPCKGAKSLTTYFEIALRFVSYFCRVVAPDEYRISPVVDMDDDNERNRLGDIVEATD
jgi:hypothetical protein